MSTDDSNDSVHKPTDDRKELTTAAAIADNLDLNAVTKENEVSLDGAGIASITSTSTNKEQDEDDNAYYRDQIIACENKKFTPTDSAVQGNGNGKGKSKKSGSRRSNGRQADKKDEKSKPTYTAYKYSNNGKAVLHESIILAGRPAFIAYENGQLHTYDAIQEDTRVIKPPHPESYLYTPYEFASMDEVLRYRDRALSENIDSLYLKTKQIASDYNDQRNEKIRLLAIEIIASYFQDRFLMALIKLS